MGNPDLSRAVVQGTARLQEAVARQEWRRGSTLLGGKSDNKHASPPGSGRFFCISEDQNLCELEIARVVSSNKFKIVKRVATIALLLSGEKTITKKQNTQSISISEMWT